MDSLISRQAAIAIASGYCHPANIAKELAKLPPAQPETDSFCTDCKEYDQDRHFCPRFDRVIKRTVEEMKAEQRWIPVSERLPSKYGIFLVTMTEKAKAEELGFDVDEIDVRKMRYNSNGWQLPRHIPSWINDVVTDEVLAWMPLPEPYREEGAE